MEMEGLLVQVVYELLLVDYLLIQENVFTEDYRQDVLVFKGNLYFAVGGAVGPALQCIVAEFNIALDELAHEALDNLFVSVLVISLHQILPSKHAFLLHSPLAQQQGNAQVLGLQHFVSVAALQESF